LIKEVRCIREPYTAKDDAIKAEILQSYFDAKQTRGSGSGLSREEIIYKLDPFEDTVPLGLEMSKNALRRRVSL
jgi:hypothetical protein